MDEPLADTLYEIQDGVRRAKAAWLCGRETIPAQVGGRGPVYEVALNNLRSPHKDLIDAKGVRGIDWGITYRATQRGERPPPIRVLPGSLGPTLEEVRVEEDDLDAFRRKYNATEG